LPETLHLPDQIRRAILVHAANCAPDECCGLLASDGDGRIRFAYPLTNVNPSPVTYTLDPDEHFAAFNHAESMGWEISGVFHSHPMSPATPSMVDVQAALEPEWVYLIAAPDEVRAFRIQDQEISEIALS
jgi:proteasome lid subunit RPN8/RPN11